MSNKRATEWLLSNNRFLTERNVQNGQLKTTDECKTISITGGKGGVGKTSVSLKIAKLLSENYKVLLIDCDYNLSNTHVKLGLPIKNSLYNYIEEGRAFEECLYKEGNFNLLSGCNGDLEFFTKTLQLDKLVINILIEQERNYDYIILDCPAGISKETLTLNAYTDYRFVVVTPDKSSITDSYALMKILNKKFGVNENHLLINKVSSQKQYKRIIRIISDTVDSYLQCRLHILGNINKVDKDVDLFDKYLFGSEKNSLHNNFVKVVNRFTEETQAFCDEPHIHMRQFAGGEQNVQPMIS